MRSFILPGRIERGRREVTRVMSAVGGVTAATQPRIHQMEKAQRRSGGSQWARYSERLALVVGNQPTSAFEFSSH